MIILNGNWKEEIIKAFEDGEALRGIFQKPKGTEVYKRHFFLEKIWEMSMEAFDSPREIQVVIDSNNRLFISFGTFSFVEFSEDPVGMKLPVKCWIHTHPFGSAYFSGIDWHTVNNWHSLMKEAYVLGGVDHYGHWINTKPNDLLIRWVDNNGMETFRVQQQRQYEGEEE